MAEYTPDTEVVRREYASAGADYYSGDRRAEFEAEFDRWHDGVVRNAKAEALREAADAIADPNGPHTFTAWNHDHAKVLRFRADLIERGDA